MHYFAGLNAILIGSFKGKRFRIGFLLYMSENLITRKNIEKEKLSRYVHLNSDVRLNFYNILNAWDNGTIKI